MNNANATAPDAKPIAKFIRHLTGSRGDQRLFELSAPLRDYSGEGGAEKYVVVSKINGPLATETYIFPASEDGEITSWGELPGSQKGIVAHADALRDAGYDVVE